MCIRDRHDIWREFHRYVKHDQIGQMADVLNAHEVAWREPHMTKLRARWEFSILPADGGCLRPHTDIASKLVTIVVSMRPLGDTEWQQSWGCLLYTSDAADERSSVDLGGRRIIKKK